MSVINQALKDLEQRHEQPLSDNSGQLRALELPSSRLNYLVILLVAMVLVLVGLGLSWQAGLWPAQPENLDQQSSISITPVTTQSLNNFEPTAVESNNKTQSLPITVADEQPTIVISPVPSTVATPSAPEKPVIKIADVKLQSTVEKPAKQTVIKTTSNSTSKKTVKLPAKQAVTKAIKKIKAVPPSPTADVVIAKTKTKTKIVLPEPQVIPAVELVEPSAPAGELTIERVELTPTESAAALLKQGLAQADRGLMFKAQDSWRASLLALPAQHQAREYLARSYANQNNMAEGLNVLIRGIELFPKQWSFKLLAAKIYLHNQRQLQALSVLDRPYRFAKADNEILDLAGAIAQQLQQWPQAQHNYAQLVMRNKTNHKWLMGLAIALDAQAKPQAIARYQQLLALPDIAPVLINYAKQRIEVLQSQQ